MHAALDQGNDQHMHVLCAFILVHDRAQDVGAAKLCGHPVQSSLEVRGFVIADAHRQADQGLDQAHGIHPELVDPCCFQLCFVGSVDRISRLVPEQDEVEMLLAWGDVGRQGQLAQIVPSRPQRCRGALELGKAHQQVGRACPAVHIADASYRADPANSLAGFLPTELQGLDR
ncbi:hypothetical protein KAQ61_03405 [Comamonas aquatica]|nr:hypothetical protein [Comamonas aquatica]QTX22857.1 hypothetical protein KAQ61_03405 [Comamonas aquatica]